MPVVGVLDRDPARERLVVVVFRAEGRLDLAPRHHAPLGGERTHLDAAQRGRAGAFIEEDVGLVVGDQLLAGGDLGQDAEQVAHGAAGHEESRLLAHRGRRALLKPVDGGVFAENVVAQLCVGHGAAHLWRGHGQGVGAHVDHG